MKNPQELKNPNSFGVMGNAIRPKILCSPIMSPLHTGRITMRHSDPETCSVFTYRAGAAFLAGVGFLAGAARLPLGFSSCVCVCVCARARARVVGLANSLLSPTGLGQP